MDTEAPVKTYIVKSWDVRLKSGSVASYNIREDQGQTFAKESGDHGLWYVWRWPTLHKESKILAAEIAAIDYEEITQRELPAYKPKRGDRAQTAKTIDQSGAEDQLTHKS